MTERIGLNEYGPLRRVALRHPRVAFGGPEVIAASWRDLNYLKPPDYGRALADYDRLAEILSTSGAEIDWLPAAEGLTLDSLYVHDAALPGPRGIVLCNMGKPARAREPAAMERAFEGLGLHVDQGLMIATLEIQVAGFVQVVLDDDIQPIGHAQGRNGTDVAVVEQRREFLLGGQFHLPAQQIL